MVRSLGVGGFSDWGVVEAKGSTIDILVFWDNKVFDLIDIEAYMLSLFYVAIKMVKMVSFCCF